MIRDFRGSPHHETMECDVCIAGGGAAGISIALAFIGRKERVVLLESGGLELDDRTQDLYIGQNVGQPYFDLVSCRLRFLGGSTNHWAGVCAPLDPEDFEARDWVSYSGWPITLAELEPFYAGAQPLLELGSHDYAVAATPLSSNVLPVAPDLLLHKLLRLSPPTRFGEAYRTELERAQNVEVLLHANLVEIETGSEGNAVATFRVASLDDSAALIRAKAYVLALGGIENPRLLLNSNRAMASGLGNQNDLVGRFFMEHLRVAAGTALATADEWVDAYEATWNGQKIIAGLRPSFKTQRKERILNSIGRFESVRLARSESEGYRALRELKQEIMRGQFPDNLAEDLWSVISDLDGIVRAAWERADPLVYLDVQAEQAPNPESRVSLRRERDQLGLHRVQLQWRLSPIDKLTVRTYAKMVGLEMGRLGTGRLKLDEWLEADDQSWSEDLVGAYHHMGTTRMADDPSRGVVDADCRVFGMDNLYVAGSSVFPTGGCTSPTLTIVALALRLADHLKTRLGSAP